jgi:putative endopeptidase
MRPVPALLCAALAACSGGAAKQRAAAPPAPAPAPPPAPAAAPAMTLADSGIVAEWMDRSVDPCQDFFAYACGGFLKTAEIPADRYAWGTISIVQKETELFLKDVLEKAAASPGEDPAKKKIGDAYAACMDETAIEKAGIAPLHDLMAAIAAVKDPASAAKAIMELHASAVWAFFDVHDVQDFGDATKVIAELDQEGLGLPDRDYYLKDEGNMKSVRAAYRDHVKRYFALLEAPPRAADDALRIETAVAKLQQDQVLRRDPHAIYHKIDRAGLEKAAPSFPWAAYFERLGLGGVTALTVHDPKYYAAIAAMLGREKPAALRAYMTLALVRTAAPELSKPFVDEDFRLDQVLKGLKELPPRWRHCVERSDKDLGELLAQPYVAARFAGESKQRAVELTRAVLDAMAVELAHLPWMDEPTRVAAKHKLEKMAYLVGYPDRWRAYDFAIDRGGHFANFLAARRFELQRHLHKIGQPVDHLDWGMTPPTVNAEYDSNLNRLELPAGQLQPPFFAATFHPAVNFGATGGSTIGHEMTHGFDDEGSQFDAEGNLRDWWSKSSGEAFHKAAKCVIDQYDKYEALPGVHLNGANSAGENIADIGGVKIGYEAYKAWRAKQTPPPPATVDGMSDDQMYFLSYGQSWCMALRPERLETIAHSDEHSPPQWRVNGVIVDEPGFAEAFKCPVGRPMNPGNSCSVW